MWKKNLTFALLVLGGLAVAVSMLPGSTRRSPRQKLDLVPRDRELDRQVVRLNQSFYEMWALEPAPPANRADDLTLIRRVSLALCGTIPSLEEIRALEATNPEDPLRWWLEGTLADRRHADYLAERLGRTFVGIKDGPFLVYRRRRFMAWLSDQILQNKPYDHVVSSLIADTGLWTDAPSTNFLTVTLKPEERAHPDAMELAARVSRTFLAVRMDCAQCHDHPFDRWKQEDFHGLAAFFSQVKQGFNGIQDDEGEYEFDHHASGQRQVLAPQVPFHRNDITTSGTLREQLAAWIIDPKNERFALATCNRMWGLMTGAPLVDPVDSIGPIESVPPPLKVLAEEFRKSGYDLRQLIRLIVASDAFQRDSRGQLDANVAQIAEDAQEVNGPTSPAASPSFSTYPLTRLRAEQTASAVIQAATLETIDADASLISRFVKYVETETFVRQYGDAGENEMEQGLETTPQRLQMMNGQLVKNRTKNDLFVNAAPQIAELASTDEVAVQTAYLAVLTRYPSDEELQYFCQRLATRELDVGRAQKLEDLYWALINSAEFSWNH